MANLSRSLSLVGGTSLFLNIVIGAGLLVLPGLVYKQTGPLALASWLLCAVVVLPVLAVFVVLGRNYPDAGGISHYAYRAFGEVGRRTASLLFLGAVAFGLPSIAMTGGYYIQSVAGGPVHLYAALLILSAAWMHRYSGKILSRCLALIGSSVLATLLLLMLVGLSHLRVSLPLHWSQWVPTSNNFSVVVAPFMMIFFAFTGWEVGSHTAEEFEHPKRDFPRAMILSFIIATVIYAGIAILVQLSNLSGNLNAPFVEITRPALGAYGKHFVAMVAVVLIFANLFGAIWGISRLVYSLSRDQVIPGGLAVTSNGVPIRAVLVTTSILLGVLLLDCTGALGIEKMLALAGQNFLLLYGLAAWALLVLTRNPAIRVLSGFVVFLVGGLILYAGSHLLYPAALVGIGILSATVGKRIKVPFRARSKGTDRNCSPE